MALEETEVMLAPLVLRVAISVMVVAVEARVGLSSLIRCLGG